MPDIDNTGSMIRAITPLRFLGAGSYQQGVVSLEVVSGQAGETATFIKGIVMPIRPENKARYPKNWKQIADGIRDRANQKCEGSPDYPDCRAENGKPHPITGSKVVLTVAHLDHTPENCNPENLKAWCQKCHLNYDKHHHAKTAYATRKAAANTVDMFASSIS